MIVLILCYKDANLDNHPDNISKHGLESESTYKARAVRRYCSICSVENSKTNILHYLIKLLVLTVPEKEATCMFCLSIAVCCPFRSLMVTLGKPRQFSGPKSDYASFNLSRLPTR